MHIPAIALEMLCTAAQLQALLLDQHSIAVRAPPPCQACMAAVLFLNFAQA